MAKPKNNATDKTLIFNLDIPLTESVCEAIVGMVEQPDLTTAQKVGGVALKCLNDLAAGGIMLEAAVLNNLQQAAGVEIEDGEDLIPIISEAVGMKDGMMVIPYYVDPADMPGYEETAEMQGRPVQEVVQDLIDFVRDNGMIYTHSAPHVPDNIRMHPAEHAELEGILEGKFQNGTELAALVKKFIGADGLFDGVFASSAEEKEHASA